MYEYLIYSQLKKHGKDLKSFHMPGHKGRGDFKSKFKVAKLDVTELDWSDNLHSPSGIIDAAQRDIAVILGAKKSFITTDGSSSGVLAMLYCASLFGNKIIVFRSSHQSVFNGCKLFGLEPLVIRGEEREGVLLPPDADAIEKLIESDSDISGVLVTSPDYYGNIAPLEKYAEVTKKYNRFLFVDGAHGAHLAFGGKGYAGEYADMWVDGAHKTLATLTQGAIVNVNNEKLLGAAEDALSYFRTTSPSYPIMASVEYGVKYAENHKKEYANTLEEIEEFKKESGYTFYPSDDPLKLLIDFKPLGVSADKAAALLEKKGIYPEFSDGRYILLYLSPYADIGDLKKLRKKLDGILSLKKLKNTYKEKPPIPAADRSYSFRYALKKQSEWIDLNKATGKMCAKNAGVIPPCAPIVVAGELITPEMIAVLSASAHTFGLKDKKICVVKK